MYRYIKLRICYKTHSTELTADPKALVTAFDLPPRPGAVELKVVPI